MTMIMKEIPVKQIRPNLMQPREHFNKEKLQELAESILSNGLINPIIVRAVGSEYEIVAGERRWQAHKIAQLKTILAIVKEYENEGQRAIESLIENVHREDLMPIEKAKSIQKIMNMKGITKIADMSKILGMNEKTISEHLSLLPIEKEIKEAGMHTSDYSTLSDISNVKDKDTRKKLLKSIEGRGTAEVRQMARIMKSEAPKEVKKALLNDEISTEQAKKISKLKDASQRTKAIKEHKAIKTIDERIEKSIEYADKHKEKKSDYIQIIKVNKWIKSFRYSVTDSAQQLGKTFKILQECVKYISLTDDRQKKELEEQLDRFSELLERGEQLTEQIKDKL